MRYFEIDIRPKPIFTYTVRAESPAAAEILAYEKFYSESLEDADIRDCDTDTTIVEITDPALIAARKDEMLGTDDDDV